MLSKKVAVVLSSTLIILSVLAAQCGAPATPQTIVEKVIETVVVEKEGEKVIETVVVEKTVEVTKIVEKVVEVTPEPAEPTTLRVGLVGNIKNLDPHESVGLSETIWTYIFEGLGEVDENGVAQPSLAESWEYLDPTHIQFNLRKGATFHDGTPWNAQEAVKSINRMINPDSPGPDVNYYQAVTSAEVVDDSTILVTLSHPDPVVLQAMSVSFFVMTPADRAETLATDPVGTGPWKFAEWVPDQYVRLARNDDWWGSPKPAADFLEFRFFEEETTRLLALQAGEIDIAFNVSPTAVDMVVDDPNLTLIKQPTPRILIIDLNVKNPPTDDPRVRHAVSLAIDTETMVNEIAGESAVPITVFYAPFYPEYFDAGFIEYDPQQAEALLEEAGWVDANGDGIREKDGQPLKLTWMVAEARDPYNRDMPVAAQEMLAAVGFDAEIVFTEMATIRSASLEPDPGPYNLFGMRGFSNQTFDPIHTLLQFQEENASPKTAGGETRYTTPEVDGWIKDYLASTDAAEKSELLKNIQLKLYEDMPAIPLYNAARYSVISNNVVDFVDHPNEWYTYRFNPIGISR